MNFIQILAAGLICATPLHGRPAPGFITSDKIEGFYSLDTSRQKFIQTSLDEASRLQLSRYLFGSADPINGGFDCSGSVLYLLGKIGIRAPRTSFNQYEWTVQSGTFHSVPDSTTQLDHPAFSMLQPGDLLFWSYTYETTDGRTSPISHVQIYLGKEINYGHIMIGSSDGRSYRGSARSGFGVFDFKLPRIGAKARFVGYATPPGLIK